MSIEGTAAARSNGVVGSSVPRGRGRGRGRGGAGRGGGAAAANISNGSHKGPAFEDAAEDEDLKALRSSYSDQLPILSELFPDWTDADLLSTLKDANGDMELAITRITEGTLAHKCSICALITFDFAKATLSNGEQSRTKSQSRATATRQSLQHWQALFLQLLQTPASRLEVVPDEVEAVWQSYYGIESF